MKLVESTMELDRTMPKLTQKCRWMLVDNDYESNNYRTPLPASAEEAEDLLINKAINLAMKRIDDETASNGLIAEIIKLGTAKERLQKEKLRQENDLLRAKTESIKSQKNSEEFYASVLKALHSYAPTIYTNPEDEEDDYYES